MTKETFTTDYIRQARGLDGRVWVDARSVQNKENELRDQFALVVLQQIMLRGGSPTSRSSKAEEAYGIADEMLKAREGYYND